MIMDLSYILNCRRSISIHRIENRQIPHPSSHRDEIVFSTPFPSILLHSLHFPLPLLFHSRKWMMSKDSSLTIRILTFYKTHSNFESNFSLVKIGLKIMELFQKHTGKPKYSLKRNDANSLDKVWTNHLHSDLLCKTETYDWIQEGCIDSILY